jgi:hypothetical protein
MPQADHSPYRFSSGNGFWFANGFGFHFGEFCTHDLEVRISVQFAYAGIGEHLKIPWAAAFIRIPQLGQR